VHETISILCKSDKGTILKNKIPYVEMKAGDLASIQQDVKRISSALKNPAELNRLLEYLQNFEAAYVQHSACNHTVTKSEKTKDDFRSAITLNSIHKGITEKSIVHVPRTDRVESEHFTKHHATRDQRLAGSRSVDSMQSICQGLNEKSIIVPAEETPNTIFEELRNHYDSVHPTQKPVRLLERLLLILAEIDTPTIVLDPFMGSGSTALAAQNLGFDFIGYEIDAEYFQLAQNRVEQSKNQHKLF
jgi:site-specific DNA-methyltransferase (adenine-specific)